MVTKYEYSNSCRLTPAPGILMVFSSGNSPNPFSPLRSFLNGEKEFGEKVLKAFSLYCQCNETCFWFTGCMVGKFNIILYYIKFSYVYSIIKKTKEVGDIEGSVVLFY